MKPSTFLLFAVNYLGLASAAAIANPDGSLHAIEKRACFKTGASYGNDQDVALNAVETACKGPLQGKYDKRETRVKCYNLSGNKSVKLTVGLTGSNAGSTRTIGSDECIGGLSKEVVNCQRGGDTTYGNWRYR